MKARNGFTFSERSAARWGFSLIELLVVVAIISLLVSILLPSLTKAKDLGRSVVCLSNQKNIHLAWSMYANDSHGVLPALSTPTSTSGAYFDDTWNVWTSRVGSYLEDPVLRQSKPDEQCGVARFSPNGPLTCPSFMEATRFKARDPHYGVNFLMRAEGWDGWDTFANVPFPSETILLMDSAATSQWGHFLAGAGWGQVYIAYRHLDGANVVYTDGHAVMETKDVLYAPEPTSAWVGEAPWQPKP